MDIKKAIMAFSQSEKLKSGLIWVSQVLEFQKDLSEPQKQGAERVIKAIIDMIVSEVRFAKGVTGDELWDNVEKHIDRAIVMINSGVAPEAVVHLTQALSQVTSIGHRSMSALKEQELI